VRNVGSVGVVADLAVATGRSGQGFTGVASTTSVGATLSKGEGKTITISGLTGLKSGDVVTIKVTTTAGTFAQATYIVP
jgi:predicted RNA-binding protein with TRAM domain